MSAVLAKSRLVAFLAVCAAIVTTAVAATTGWHGLSQSQRNSRILNRADDDLNQNVGMSCKEWVRRVVRNASGGEVGIPSNQNDYTWNSHPYVYRCPQPYPISWVQPGQIIQMRWTNANGTSTPHTAIVLSRTSTSMTWIDSNWQGDEVVRTHSMTYSHFNNRVGNNYNIYEIR
jgi:hypothetical protein